MSTGMKIKKSNFYHQKLNQKKSLLIIFHLKIKKTKKFGQLSKILSSEPKECLGAYVISMTSSASDILSVNFFKNAGIKHKIY